MSDRANLYGRMTKKNVKGKKQKGSKKCKTDGKKKGRVLQRTEKRSGRENRREAERNIYIYECRGKAGKEKSMVVARTSKNGRSKQR